MNPLRYYPSKTAYHAAEKAFSHMTSGWFYGRFSRLVKEVCLRRIECGANTPLLHSKIPRQRVEKHL